MRLMMLRLQVFALMAVSLLSGCPQDSAQSSTPEFMVTFLTEGEDKVPLAGVQTYAEVGGKKVPLELTKAAGFVSANFQGAEGEVIKVSYDCPKPLVPVDKEVTLVLRKFTSLDPGKGAGLSMRLRCQFPLVRTMIAVKTNLSKVQIPVRINDALVGKTNTRGVALFAHESTPGTSFVVKLDTSERPELAPATPLRTFVVEQNADVFVFEQNFEGKKKTKTRRSRRRRPRRRGPTRIKRI